MVSITEIVLRNIGSVGDSYVSNISEPSRVLEHVGGVVRDSGGLILPFEAKALSPGVSLCAVDGGNASEKLSGGDLVVAGATLGEGAKSARVWDEGDIPAEVWVSVLPHLSSNDLVEKSMRALLELQVLADAGTDVRIIDGAYLGNVSQVLYGLTHRDSRVVNVILDTILGDSSGRLERIFSDILHPPRDRDNLIVAIPKSDSSTVFVDGVLAEHGLGGFGFTDRLFASRVLLPGEFLMPRKLETNMPLVGSLEKSLSLPDFGVGVSDRGALLGLVSDKPGLLRRLGQGPTELGLLWTTYFKPSAWDKFGAVVRIEFLFHADESSVRVEDKARELIALVDQDIIDSTILEPWCQFYADRRAKDVSTAITIVKTHLLNQPGSSTADVLGLLRKYRT